MSIVKAVAIEVDLLQRTSKRLQQSKAIPISVGSKKNGPYHCRSAAKGMQEFYNCSLCLYRSLARSHVNVSTKNAGHEPTLLQRAEHNDGMLSTLQEITLHQQNIERIELLGYACRNLKILYLQNNIIAKIENLHRLKVACFWRRCCL